GRRFLVVWYEVEVTDEGTTNRVYTGTLLEPDGTIVKSDIPIVETNFAATEFDLAAALGKFMLVAHRTDFDAPAGPNRFPSNLVTATVKDDGTTSTPNVLPIGTPVFGLNLASDGNSFLAVWANSSRLTGAMMGLNISNAGTAAGTPFTIASGSFETGALAW